MSPRATYRLQLHAQFGFDAAAAVVPYLARLGISHVYASPYLKARPGSQHGYDIVDHAELNPQLGGEAAFARLRAALADHGMGQILDFVPNHMGVGGADNPLWLDVLEWGPDSAYAGWFDIEWDPDNRYLHDKVLVPLLGDQYGLELARGKLRLKYDEDAGGFAVWAYETHKLPICPLQYGLILGNAHAQLEQLGDAFAWLRTWRPQVVRRARELQAELAGLVRARADIREALLLALDRFEGRPEDLDSWQALQQLIAGQHWRIAHFRVAADDINYRRFFNINDLAGLRMELPEVFDHAHRRPLQWLREGTLDGLRIDHIDGLLDPAAYLRRLRAQMRAAGREQAYLVVEKILAPHERLRSQWPVDGTTGYDFTNLVAGLLLDPGGETFITEAYARFTGERRSFVRIVRDCKLHIMANEMAGELNMLARETARLARQNPRTEDFTRNLLRRALKELVACFPVYRTYIDSQGAISEEDRRDIDWALAQARRNETELDPSVFDFLQQLLGGGLSRPHSGYSRSAVLRCAMRLQQYCGPVMAKGLEDTAFYRYNRCIALNEVGGAPERFGLTLAAFHKTNAQRADNWPRAMLSTSTHDTKRGEDARARLAVLSELPQQWLRLINTCSRILRGADTAGGNLSPDRNDEYLLYQLLLGSWPAPLLDDPSSQADSLQDFARRLRQAFIKSIREARLHSNWAFPDAAYEDAALGLIDTALFSARTGSFLGTFLPWAQRIAGLGVHNSLVQTAVKLTAPGMPDIYQGAESWDLSLVDPDNRRPIDFSLHERRLQQIQTSWQRGRRSAMRRYLRDWHSGDIKLALTATLLSWRRDHPELFAAGSYLPLAVHGTQAERVCAYARVHAGQVLLLLANRWPARQTREPLDEHCLLPLPEPLQGRRWHELLCGTQIQAPDHALHLRDLLADLPVAVLVSAQPSG